MLHCTVEAEMLYSFNKYFLFLLFPLHTHARMHAHTHTHTHTHTQPLGYRHCKTVISGWQKSEEMRRLLTSPSEEEGERNRRQYFMEKFEVHKPCCLHGDNVVSMVMVLVNVEMYLCPLCPMH